MRGIFFEEKLGETRRNSEGVVGGWGWGGSGGRDGSGGVGVVRIAPDSLTRQLPTTPKGD